MDPGGETFPEVDLIYLEVEMSFKYFIKFNSYLNTGCPKKTVERILGNPR